MYSKGLGVFRGMFKYTILLGILLGLFSTLVTSPAHAVAGINQQINFQGRLLNSQGATVPDGYYNIEFKIYQDGDGTTVGDTAGSPIGTLKWTEDHLNANSTGVLVKNGFMSVDLGSITSLGSGIDWNQNTLWLSLNIGTTNTSCTPFTSCTPDGEMVPMKRLSSTPYSLNSGLLGGMSNAQFVQLAQGVQTDATTNTNSIYINKTGSGNLIDLQAGGTDVFVINNTGDLTFGATTNHTLSLATASAGVAGKALTVAAGSALNSGTGAAGGSLVLQGGNAGGTGNNNGGDITLTGGSGTGTGTKGLVTLSAAAYAANTNTTCSADCTIDVSNVDNFGTVVVSASTSDINITLPPPSRTNAVGRIVYITSDNASQNFTLTTNTGTNAINVAMRKNTTATMIWNGTNWTAGGASNATTLQAAYANGSNPSTTPEIKLDSTRGTIDIQDADVSINQDLFNIHGSNPTGLGTVLFGVSNTGRVTIQGTTDQSSAFRVLNSSNNYQLNVNSANGYVISNSTQSVDNEIANPGFEAGGTIAGGEEGWFGSTQASFLNDPTNAHTGNYSMAVLPNGTAMDFYAGSYREVRAGDSYYLGGYVKQSGANGSAGVQITWYDKDHGVLGYSSNYDALVTGSYKQYTVNATAPTNAVYARISATVRSDANAGTYYFDDFNFIRNMKAAPYTFINTTDSTTAFRIQSAGAAQTLFTADTADNILKVGDNTGSDTATTLLVLDSTNTDPTTLANKNGGLYYNSSTNSLKAVVGGAVVDVCTTAVTCSGYSASAGSVVQLQSSTPGTQQTGNFNISGVGMLTALKTQDNTTGSSSNLTIQTGNAANPGKVGDLILDVGSGGSTNGSIQIGHAGINTVMAGTLAIQGNNSITLGMANTNTGSIVFGSAGGTNTVTLKGPDTNPAVSYTLTLPSAAPVGGTCLKTDSNGGIYYQNCGVGANVNMQDVYNNSGVNPGDPGSITTTDNKNIVFTATDTTTDSNILMNLQCTTGCGTNGRFAVQNAGVDVFTVNPNSGNVLIGTTNTSNMTAPTLLQLGSFSGDAAAEVAAKPCSTTVNQGALYYNYAMGSLRGCINGSWADISNPDTLGLLTFGVIPSSGGGNNAYDLPALTILGVSGPCKVSWKDATTVTVQPCNAYSGGRRVSVSNATDISVAGVLTNANYWGHICLNGTNGAPVLTAGSSSPTANLPTWSITSPILCLADIRLQTTGGSSIAAIYDTRTFSSTLKEPVNTSAAVELGMLVDAGSTGAMQPATSASQKLYGTVIAADSTRPTSAGAPNAIVATVGPAWVKGRSGTAGSFVITSLTSGYASTNTSIPNNSFYYSAGNTRTSVGLAQSSGAPTFAACTSASNCSGSMYVNFIVR